MRNAAFAYVRSALLQGGDPLVVSIERLDEPWIPARHARDILARMPQRAFSAVCVLDS